MSKVVLVFPFPLLSHYLRLAELLRGLPDTQVLFAGDCPPAGRVEALGFDTFPTEQFDARHALEQARKFSFSWLNLASLERVLESQIQAIEHFRPAVVVSDAAQTARIAAEYTRTPHIAIANAYMTRYYAGFRGLPENHAGAKYVSALPPQAARHIVRAAESTAMCRVHTPFRRLRRNYRLRPVRSYLSEFQGDRTVIVDDVSIFPVAKLPSSFSVAGPVYFTGSGTSGQRVPPPGSSAPGLSRRRHVVVSLGSSGVWADLHLLDLPAFSSFDITVLGTKDTHLERVRCADFSEPGDVLPGADVIICHGGNGTIYQALSYGIPVLCRPSMFEQEWNVTQFELAGLVKRLPQQCSPESLLREIEAACTSTRIGQEQRKWSIDESRRAFHGVMEEIIAATRQGQTRVIVPATVHSHSR